LKMKKHLILVRHSLPEIAENLPAHEWKLSEEGRARAEQLAGRLTRYRPEVIVSSVEPKARETAGIIAEKQNLELHVLEGLHEHDRSQAPYLTGDEFERSVREFFEKPGALVFGNETADECHARFERSVRSVLSRYPDQTIALVAHGTVISLFVSRLIRSSGLLIWKELGLPCFLVVDVQSASLIERENIP